LQEQRDREFLKHHFINAIAELLIGCADFSTGF